MRVHHALGVAGRAGGEEHGRHVVRRGLRHLGVEEAGVAGVVGLASLDEGVDRQQAGLVVIAQAARVVVPDMRQLRALLAQLDHLVDLLLVFHDREAHLGVVHREHVLGRHRVLVQRHRNGAQRLRRQHRRVQTRAVLTHHHHVVAACDAERRHAARQLAHQRRQLPPGGGLPDAVFLLAQGRRVGARGGVLEQQAGECGLHRTCLLGRVRQASGANHRSLPGCAFCGAL